MTQTTIYKGSNAAFVAKGSPKNAECGQDFVAGDNQNTKSNPTVSANQKSQQTVVFQNPPAIVSGGAVVTQREADGPIGHYFDTVVTDKMDEKNFENAEIRMIMTAVTNALNRAKLAPTDIDMLLAGDLLNQITSSSYVARELSIPYLGLYSACSTMSQALAVGACMLNAGYFKHVACATASHFATAERQYRYPLEYGAQRPPYAQWTVTGAGCTILSADAQQGARIKSATFGKVVDYGVNDISNMGAAMAPAAMDTLYTMFGETNTRPNDYDLILTGDLGKLGSDILRDLMREQGYTLGQNYADCGALIYDVGQKAYQGGSGCGCSASVFNSYILKQLQEKRIKRMAFLATGALMSPQSTYQGETIPCISHAIVIEND